MDKETAVLMYRLCEWLKGVKVSDQGDAYELGALSADIKRLIKEMEPTLADSELGINKG